MESAPVGMWNAVAVVFALLAGVVALAGLPYVMHLLVASALTFLIPRFRSL